MKPAQPNQSLIDGLACLQFLAAHDGPIGCRDLARQMGLETTRVNRLLGTLSFLGLAEQDAERRYQSGPGMHVLSAQALKGSRLLQRALPVLEPLRRTKLTVALGVLWRDQVCYLYHGEPGRPITEGVFHFDLFPAEQSAIGLMLLARQKNPAGLSATTRRRLPSIRRDDYCFLERPEADNALAVSIGTPAVAALAFAGAFKESETAPLLTQLRAAATRIAAAPTLSKTP
jgi:DNA-binding IclR family transcriptional regulator